MASCEHLAWLQVIGINDLRLLDPNRMSQLIRKLKNLSNQRPSSLLFVGRQAKNLALRELFLDNNFKKHFCDDVTTLRIDNASTYFDHSIFFAKSSPSQAIPLAVEDSHVCETKSFLIQWAKNTIVQHLYNVLHAHLFYLFADVVCVFVDDFVDFEHVVQLLKSWVAIDSASVHFDKIRPRVVIVRRGDATSPSPTYDLLKIDDLQQGLHDESLKEFFSSIKVLHLAGEQLSPLARFRRLKELLWREMDEMRQTRQNLDCLYSAKHTARFFRMTVGHIAASTSRPFDFILASRRGNEVEPDFVHHLSRFLRCGEDHQVPRDALMTFIASSIMLDVYPPKMHGKTILAPVKTAISDQNPQSSIQRCFMTFNIGIFVFSPLLRHIMIAISFSSRTPSFVASWSNSIPT